MDRGVSRDLAFQVADQMMAHDALGAHAREELGIHEKTRARPIQASAGNTAYDSTLADAMSDYWVAFATSADPNGAPAAGKWPRWPKYDGHTDEYIELGPTIVAKQYIRRALYDSLDVQARARGEVRP